MPAKYRILTTYLSDLRPNDVDPYLTASFAYSIYKIQSLIKII